MAFHWSWEKQAFPSHSLSHTQVRTHARLRRNVRFWALLVGDGDSGGGDDAAVVRAAAVAACSVVAAAIAHQGELSEEEGVTRPFGG